MNSAPRRQGVVQEIVQKQEAPISIIPVQAHSDEHLIELWLHGKSKNSQRAYRRDIDRFLNAVGKELQAITLGDFQTFIDSLDHLSDNTRKRGVMAVKSLFSFGQKLGYLQFNVGGAVKAPKVKNKLAERILTEEELMRMLALTTKERDRILLRLLYASAGRVSEIAQLHWRDCQPNGNSGQVTLFGKGGETRMVKLSTKTWAELQSLRGEATSNAPVFLSRNGGALGTSTIWRIVRSAGERAGLEGVSPHWMRHSHASHALERGASVALVRDTLGHSSVATTSKYLHAKPDESSALHLPI